LPIRCMGTMKATYTPGRGGVNTIQKQHVKVNSLPTNSSNEPKERTPFLVRRSRSRTSNIWSIRSFSQYEPPFTRSLHAVVPLPVIPESGKAVSK
jgi:hypothetical protein